MATAIAEPPHLTADLKALYLSTVASQWRPLAEQAARQRQAPADYWSCPGYAELRIAGAMQSSGLCGVTPGSACSSTCRTKDLRQLIGSRDSA